MWHYFSWKFLRRARLAQSAKLGRSNRRRTHLKIEKSVFTFWSFLSLDIGRWEREPFGVKLNRHSSPSLALPPSCSFEMKRNFLAPLPFLPRLVIPKVSPFPREKVLFRFFP